MNDTFWRVAVDAPLLESLTYLEPEALRGLLKRGQSVIVPLGKRKANGVLLEQTKETPTFKIKNVESIIEDYNILPDFFLKWIEWIALYYYYPVGSVASLVFPPLKRTEKTRASKKAPVIKVMERSFAPTLTEEQTKVISSILKHSTFSTHLVFGVTGSGKTEIYMHLLEQVLIQGKRGLVLVPEISLTPQLVQRFAARFGDKIAVLHSQLTERERTNQWWSIMEGKKQILIGARSALFCPIHDLGIIVVDEEHEPSFKQEEKLKYHARDGAVMLGKFANCPVVLGSATPSLESWKNAQEGRYHLHELKLRVEGRSLPNIQIVDMRLSSEARKASKAYSEIPNWLSTELYEAIEKNLNNKKQVALFLNRRGVAPMVICEACGFIHECPNCDISLTLHGKSHLVCHYCDYHESLKEHCPDCKEGEMTPVGLGTEMLETEMGRLFPEARLARADRDEINTRIEMEELIEKMENHEVDILIGTQMIAKGLDFKNLNLVGLVLADIGFNIPDFRSTERSFQLITQVSGRSGRHVAVGDEPGQVIIQTFNPDHPSLTFAKENQYAEFAELELQHRQMSIRLQGIDLSKVQSASKKFAQRAGDLKSQVKSYSEIEILGPAEAPLAKIRGQFRYHLLLKGPDSKTLNKFCRHILGLEEWLPSGVRILLDIDPLHLL
jgi:primosomal protein N' (replication factor Y)